MQVGRYLLDQEIRTEPLGGLHCARIANQPGRYLIEWLAVPETLPGTERRRLQRRFLEESRILAQQPLHGILRVIDFGEAPEGTFRVFDDPHSTHLARPDDEAVADRNLYWIRLARDYAVAWARLAEQRVVLDDDPDGHLLVTGPGEVRLLPVGLSRIGRAAGLPAAYLVSRPAGEPDFKDDEGGTEQRGVFLVAVWLYRRITGKDPLERLRHDRAPEPLWFHQSRAPAELDSVLQRAMRPGPGDVLTVARLADALTRFLPGEAAAVARPPAQHLTAAAESPTLADLVGHYSGWAVALTAGAVAAAWVCAQLILQSRGR